MSATRDNPVKTSPYGFTKPMRLSIITTIIYRLCLSSTSGGGGNTSSVGTPTSKGITSSVCSIGGRM